MVAKSLEAEESEEKWPDPFSLADAALFASALTEAGFRPIVEIGVAAMDNIAAGLVGMVDQHRLSAAGDSLWLFSRTCRHEHRLRHL
jgi:hypothetical protein